MNKIEMDYVTFVRYGNSVTGGKTVAKTLKEAKGHAALLDSLGFEKPEKKQHIEIWKRTHERIQ